MGGALFKSGGGESVEAYSMVFFGKSKDSTIE
jgi:hypothetical protein